MRLVPLGTRGLPLLAMIQCVFVFRARHCENQRSHLADNHAFLLFGKLTADPAAIPPTKAQGNVCEAGAALCTSHDGQAVQ
jgi:hypothetical protein